MTREEILAKLEHVQHHGNYDTARCPAHNDKDPSLSIRVKENGWIQLKCHAGCEEDDILAALGMENIELLTTATNFGEPEVVYTYQDEKGDAIFQVVRFPGKRFRQRFFDDKHPDADKDGWVWHLEEDTRRVLYHLPEVIQGIKDGRTIYVAEGEKDVDNLRERWGVIATCNPGGAGKWRAEYAEMLAGANVIVIRDKGTPSERKHAENVKTSLQGRAVGIYLMQAKVGKDVTDHMDAGYRAEDLEMVKEGTRRGIITAKELAEGAREALHSTPHDIPGYVLSPQIPLVFRRGRTYAVGAYTGHGKTSYALPGFRRLSEQGHRCGYFSLEMPERDLTNKLLAHKGIPLAVTEEPWQISKDSELLRNYNEAVDEIERWQSDIIFESNLGARRIKEITEQREYDVIFVDHVHKFAWGGERRKFEEEIQMLNGIALELNVMVVLLCQLKKFDQRPGAAAYPKPTLQSFRETSVIQEEASLALAIWRHTNEEGTQFDGQTMAFVLKNRHVTGKHDAAGVGFYLNFDPARELFVSTAVEAQGGTFEVDADGVQVSHA